MSSPDSRMGRAAPPESRWPSFPRLDRIEERAEVRPEPVLKLYGCEQPVILYGPGDRRAVAPDLPPTVHPCARVEVAYEGLASTLRPGRGGDIRIPGSDGPAVIGRDREREESFRETLQRAAMRHGCMRPGALSAGIAPPPGVRDADIVFPALRDPDEADAAAAGIGFVAQTVPALRSAGWRMEIDPTWPFAVYEGPIGFSTSAGPSPSDPDWFSLALSLEADGRRIDITRTVLQIVDELPVAQVGRRHPRLHQALLPQNPRTRASSIITLRTSESGH